MNSTNETLIVEEGTGNYSWSFSPRTIRWKLSHDGGRYHIETSPLICCAKASVRKELKGQVCIAFYLKNQNDILTQWWKRFFNSFMTEAVSKSMDWFLYDNGLRHERVKCKKYFLYLITGDIPHSYLILVGFFT